MSTSQEFVHSYLESKLRRVIASVKTKSSLDIILDTDSINPKGKKKIEVLEALRDMMLASKYNSDSIVYISQSSQVMEENGFKDPVICSNISNSVKLLRKSAFQLRDLVARVQLDLDSNEISFSNKEVILIQDVIAYTNSLIEDVEIFLLSDEYLDM